MQTSKASPINQSRRYHNPITKNRCGIDCEQSHRKILTQNDHQQGLCLNRHRTVDNLRFATRSKRKSNKPSGTRAFDTQYLRPTRLISHAPILQEHEHCRPRTLPCAASFLHPSASHLGPLHWGQDTQPAETCNSTVVHDPPISKIGQVERGEPPLSRTDLRSCITASCYCTGAHFAPSTHRHQSVKDSTACACRRHSRGYLLSPYLRLCFACICNIAMDVSGGGALAAGLAKTGSGVRLLKKEGRRADAICDLCPET